MSRRGGSKRPRRGRHEPNRSATRLHAVPSPAGSPGPGSDPGAGPGPGHGSDTVPDDLLLREIREALRSDDPTAVATIVSSLLSVTSEWASGPALTIADLIAADRFDDDPFDDDPFDEDGDTPAPIPLAMLLESFIGVPFAETTAALTAMEPMLIDELEAAKVRRALATRRHPMPEHVKGVRDIAVTRAGHVGDELGDGDNVVLGLAWPGTRGVTAVIYVDEAFGTRVKDVRATIERIRDQIGMLPGGERDSGRVLLTRLEQRLGDVTDRAKRGAEVGGLLGPLEYDAAQAERDLIVGAGVRVESARTAERAGEQVAELTARATAVSALVQRCVAAVTPAPRFGVPDVRALGPVPSEPGALAAYLTKLDAVSRALTQVHTAYGDALAERDEIAGYAGALAAQARATLGASAADPDLDHLRARLDAVLAARPTEMPRARALLAAYRAYLQAWHTTPRSGPTAVQPAKGAAPR